MTLFEKLFLKIGGHFFKDEEAEEPEPQFVTWHTPNNAKCYKEFLDMYESQTHILVAGATGSGKSVFINTFLHSVLTESPASVKFAFIDPKRVELVKYKNLPHTFAYACDNDEIILTLQCIVDLMESRYCDMQEQGITKYNGCAVYVVIDELADLMTTCKKDVMPLLQRIAQLGRASNIFLLCATQAPNRQVIPAALTLNFNTRIALHCFSPIESRQIIGINDAATLPLYGEMIVCTPSGYERIEVPMIPKEELTERVNFWINQKKKRTVA